MFQPLALFVGLRYTRAKRRNHFISFISMSSMLGIALGIAALIVVLSVMNGFEREITGRILGMISHVVVSGHGGGLTDWPKVVQATREHPKVRGAAPFVEGQAMLTRGKAVRGAIVRGINPDEERTVSRLAEYMTHGSLDDLEAGAFRVLVGSGLAEELGVGVGDSVTLVAARGKDASSRLLPKLRRLRIAGIFNSDHAQYDATLAILHMSDASSVFGLGDRVTGIRARLDDWFDAPRVSSELAGNLGPDVWAADWTRFNTNYFIALKQQKTVMFVILALIVAVAAFNIVSTLVMVVTDKQSDIAILRTLGVPPRRILGIFVVQGTVIGLIGVLAGGLLGILIAANVESILPWFEEMLGRKFLESSIYFISEVPSDMRWSDVWTITGVAFALSIVATLYPAWRASRTQPAEALRYE